jgi:hypothetical protein
LVPEGHPNGSQEGPFQDSVQFLLEGFNQYDGTNCHLSPMTAQSKLALCHSLMPLEKCVWQINKGTATCTT